MKDIRCLLGRHAYLSQGRGDAQANREGEGWFACARCGKTTRVTFRPGTQGDQEHRGGGGSAGYVG
jgi:hypothetical protein